MSAEIEIRSKPLILVVEDEEDILELVKYTLVKEGYQILTATSGEEALKLARREHPELMVLDLMLPGLDGLEVCKILKNNPDTKNLAIIMLTAKGEETDIVVGLELGADDYLPKPFSPRVLAARVKTLLRRRRPSAEPSPETVLRFAGLTLQLESHEVLVDHLPVELTSTEFRILGLLTRRPGWVFNRDQIVDEARGENYPVTSRSVDVHIVSLRKKLGPYGDLIETVRGVGYRFRRPDLT